MIIMIQDGHRIGVFSGHFWGATPMGFPRSPFPRQEPPYPPPKKGRTGRRSSLRSGPRRKGKKGGVDDSKTCAVDIRNLLYSQKSCKVGHGLPGVGSWGGLLRKDVGISRKTALVHAGCSTWRLLRVFQSVGGEMNNIGMVLWSNDIWLVVSNMAFMFPYIRKNNPNWLSLHHFSAG